MSETVAHKIYRQAMSGRPKRHKFGIAQREDRTDADGQVFDSKAEMITYHNLQLVQRAGLIKDLQRQVKFILQEEFISRQHGDIRAINYIADFMYLNNGYHSKYLYGTRCVVDVKGHLTVEYRIKKKMFLYKYGDYLFFEVYSNKS